VEIGTFQPSFGFKDFRRAAQLHLLTNGQFGGEKRVGLRPLPHPQLQGFSSSGLRRRSEASRGLPSRGLASRFFLPHLGVETILHLCGGGVLQPCRGRRTAAAQPGCSIPSSVRATAASHTRGSHNTSYAVRAVLVFWDGPILVFVARTGVRTCRCALGRPALAGAVLVAAGEVLVADEIVGAICAPGLRLFGFDSLSSPLEWGRGRGPCRSSVCPEVIAAAVWPPGAEVVVAAAGVGGGEPPGSCRPAGLLVWRLFIPAGTEPESRL
jgi:hypothetical protein